MSFGSNGVDISLVAAADQTAQQYRGGTVDANGNFIIATAAGQSVIGVLQNNPASGQAASVRVGGVSKMVAGGAITAGALIKVDNQGRAVAATLASITQATVPNNVTGSDVIGIALKGAGGAGEIIPVIVEPRGAVAGTAA